MTNLDKIIDDILIKEGGDTVTNNPNDGGGRTQFGISEKSNPLAWQDGVVTEAEAREIYLNKYVKGPGFDKITDPYLQTQLVDFGVNSGPFIAIQKLQRILRMNDIDGILGPETLAVLIGNPPKDINNYLVASRIQMIASIVSKNPSQIKFLVGWISRALSFMR